MDVGAWRDQDALAGDLNLTINKLRFSLWVDEISWIFSANTIYW